MSNNNPVLNNRKTAKKILIILLLMVSLIFMTALKSIYVNLHNAYSYHNLYNPVPDLLFATTGSILFGFMPGYLFKSIGSRNQIRTK